MSKTQYYHKNAECCHATAGDHKLWGEVLYSTGCSFHPNPSANLAGLERGYKMIRKRVISVVLAGMFLASGVAIPTAIAQTGDNNTGQVQTSSMTKTTPSSTPAKQTTTQTVTSQQTIGNKQQVSVPTTVSAAYAKVKFQITKTVKEQHVKQLRKKTSTKKVTTRGGSQATSTRLLEVALRLEGSPYRSGGTTPKGFDCSGFTRYVFKIALGVDIPHSSAAQYSLGTGLSRDELVPGALVFFNTNGSGVSHVGIYMGDNKFINSSSSEGVSIDSLNSGYWGSRYVGARLVK